MTLVLIRHGQTEWSMSGQHTGRTDMPLTAAGEEMAVELGQRLAGYEFDIVLSSPLVRARATAELAGLAITSLEDDLMEWDYGDIEGRRTVDIRAELHDPNWVIWEHESHHARDSLKLGETCDDVAARASHVIAQVLPDVEAGKDVALIAHGHYLRIFTATWLEMASRAGRYFALDPAGICTLGFEREQRVITGWNV